MNIINVLHQLIPASKNIVKNSFSITADSVLQSLKKQNVTFQLVKLFKNDWDLECSELTDNDILKIIQIEKAGHTGDVMIVTEACSRYNMPEFYCQASALPQFVHEYNMNMFFDGDVVMIAPSSKTLTVYHHEGYCVHVRL